MKIIDLLNKIANGEKVPKKIHLIDGGWHDIRLNDEIEILEEKKIPEKLPTWFSLEKDCDNIQYANHNFETMYEKINEICDYLKSKGE